MGNPKLIPYETIVRATSGEPEAIDEVLRHYSKRMDKNNMHEVGSEFFFRYLVKACVAVMLLSKTFDITMAVFDVGNHIVTNAAGVHDTDSGAKAVYVNGYEFTELTNGTLNIRLQQFDAGYEYFTISAMDNAGNMSEVYKTKNPYYKDPADESDENPAKQLPASAEATKPGNATSTVTEHTRTDSDGNTISQTPEEQKKRKAG